MHSSQASSTLLFQGSAQIRVLTGRALEFGRRRLRDPRVASAAFAPAAMLMGAVGLGGVWMSAGQASPSLAAQPASGVARQVQALQQASLRQDGMLTHLLIDLGSPVQLATPQLPVLTDTPEQVVASLRAVEDRMVTAADLEARTRLARMSATFRATGLDARPYMKAGTATADLSPREFRDARVLAARLEVDPALARDVQRTARDLIAARTLGEAAASIPLSTPVDDPVRSSPFGARLDPFTHTIAFHPGQDFSGHYGEAIHVTAPGVVSFVGQRSGYGNCVEVDHGHGFKTRYGHMSGFASRVGEAVKTGDVIGRMGSTGRSTGVHLHYEVWASGRLLNPAPFLKTGAAMMARG